MTDFFGFDAVVFDIDGVVRSFDPTVADVPIEAALGLPAGTVFRLAFESPDIDDVVEGRITFEQWVDSVRAKLASRTARPDLVPDVFQQWIDYRGDLIHETVALIDDLAAQGIPVFAFTNGTDRIPEELDRHGLTTRFRAVLNSAVFGISKPHPAAFEQAHAAIEESLSTQIDRPRVYFVDDRPTNVNAAEAFGWRAHTFVSPEALLVELGR